MCGIIGQISFSKAAHGAPTEANFRRLLALMARRGPDDAGVWSDNGWCTLGFCRLAILDLSQAGHQPMVTPDGRYVLVYNGELYNFSELRRELEQKGIRFRSTGDAEVVLYSLVEWGTSALARFNGMFALGFYDGMERRLILARDHAGIKPIYYLREPEGLVFASQFDQILAHPWSKNSDVAADALAIYLRLGYVPAPYALLSNSHMLEPGQWLEITNDEEIRGGRYFEFPSYQEPDLHADDAYEAVNAVVTKAVRRQLVSDVPVGAALSGGIDSPLVVAKMRAVSNGTVRAFTIGTSGDALDESVYATDYARQLGVDHYVEQLSLGRVSEMLNEVVAACGEPFADPSMFPALLLSRLARKHSTVMLSGDGGDELFWGYAGRFSSVLERVAAVTRPTERTNARWNIKELLSVEKGQRAINWPRSVGDLYRSVHTHLTDGWLKRIFPDLPGWPPDCKLFEYDGWEPDRTAQWLRRNEFLSHLPMVLLKMDRASMYHSLEVRVPLLDREVIGVAQRVDWRSCLDVKRRVGKLPLRNALARDVRYQTYVKRGFGIAIDEWLRGPVREIFEECVVSRQDILGLPVNQRAIQELFDYHLSERGDYGRALWTLLSLVLWEKVHYDGRFSYKDN
jgi:asparagine synthase (glutamine-hydrolysing)